MLMHLQPGPPQPVGSSTKRDMRFGIAKQLNQAQQREFAAAAAAHLLAVVRAHLLGGACKGGVRRVHHHLQRGGQVAAKLRMDRWACSQRSAAGAQP